MKKKKTRKAKPKILEYVDLILTLTEKHLEEIHEIFKINSSKILTLKKFAGEEGDIEDPSMKELEGFREARNQIINCLMKGLNKYKF